MFDTEKPDTAGQRPQAGHRDHGRKHFPAIPVFALPSRLNPYKSAFVIGHQEPIVELHDAGRRWLGKLLRTVAR